MPPKPFIGICICLALMVSAPLRADAVKQPPRLQNPQLRQLPVGPSKVKLQIRAMRKKQANLRVSAARLAALSRQRVPSSLSPAEKKKWLRYRKFLRASSARLRRMADRWDRKIDGLERRLAKGGDSLEAMKQMQEMNRSFKMEFLNIQKAMEAENRKYRMLSDAMKKKHDKAREVIRDLR